MNVLRSRRLAALVTAVFVAIPAWGTAAGAATLRVPPGFEVSARRSLVAGVEHVVMTRHDPPLVMNLARISPEAPVDLQVVRAFDRVGPRRSAESLEHPTSMCARVDCVVGVNGDFYIPSTEEPYGGVASGGRLLRSPAAGRSQVWKAHAGQVTVGDLAWSGSITPAQGPALPLAGVNVDVPAGGIVLYTPDYGPSTRARASELVVRLGGVPRRGQPVTVELVRMADGYTPIPGDGAVLAGTGPGANALRDLWNRRAQSGPLTLRVDSDAAESVGIFPVLVSGGRPAAPDLAIDLFTGKHARTLIGTTADGTLLLVNLDDKRDASRGATIREATDILLALGVVEGGNLDGGGGSTFVVEGAIANMPTDGPGSPASKSDGDVLPHEYAPGFFERTAVNLLAIVARAGASTPGGVTPGGASSGGSAPGGAATPGTGGGGLFGPVDLGWLTGTGSSGKGGPVGAAALVAPSPLSSTPLASASTLFKVLTLVKAKAQAKATQTGPEAGASTSGNAHGDPTVDDSTTTGTRRAKPWAAAGEQAAAPAAGSAADTASRAPFLLTAALLVLAVAAFHAVAHRARRRLLPVVAPRPVAVTPRRTQPPANWW